MSTFPHLPEIDHLLTTTKAVRRRLDLTRAVPRQLLAECIEVGCFAPNASNAQEWHWVVIDDPVLRRQVGEQYRKVTEPPVRQMLETKLARGDDAGARISRSILWLAEHMSEVPAIVIPCYDVPAAEQRYRDLIPDPRSRARGCRNPHHDIGDVRLDAAGRVEFPAGAAQPGIGFGPDHGPPGRPGGHGRHPRPARWMGPDLSDTRRVHHRECVLALAAQARRRRRGVEPAPVPVTDSGPLVVHVAHGPLRRSSTLPCRLGGSGSRSRRRPLRPRSRSADPPIRGPDRTGPRRRGAGHRRRPP